MRKYCLSYRSLRLKDSMGVLSPRDLRSIAVSPERIRSIRSLYSVTQAEMAATCDVSRVTYIRWEHGQATPSRAAAGKLERLDEVVRLDLGLPYPSMDCLTVTPPDATKPAEIPTPSPKEIKTLRTATGCSQATFAALFDASRCTVARWEKGQTRPGQAHALRFYELQRQWWKLNEDCEE